jgi:hypothetical protein
MNAEQRRQDSENSPNASHHTPQKMNRYEKYTIFFAICIVLLVYYVLYLTRESNTIELAVVEMVGLSITLDMITLCLIGMLTLYLCTLYTMREDEKLAQRAHSSSHNANVGTKFREKDAGMIPLP